jgi:hypothetical protein
MEKAITMLMRDLARLAGMACLFSAVLPLAAQDDTVHWFGNYSEALQEARRTQKPIFLEFRCEP